MQPVNIPAADTANQHTFRPDSILIHRRYRITHQLLPENSSSPRINHPAEEKATETPIDTKEIRHALQKTLTKSNRGLEIKTAYAVNRKGIKPIASNPTIDTELYRTPRIKETTEFPACRKRTAPQTKPSSQHAASSGQYGAECKGTFSALSYCAKARTSRYHRNHF